MPSQVWQQQCKSSRPPRLQTVMIKFPCHVFHPILLWFRVIVMMRFLFHVLCFKARKLLSLVYIPSISSPLPCPTGLWLWLMRSWLS
jgi:hypothetical protein